MRAGSLSCHTCNNFTQGILARVIIPLIKDVSFSQVKANQQVDCWVSPSMSPIQQISGTGWFVSGTPRTICPPYQPCMTQTVTRSGDTCSTSMSESPRTGILRATADMPSLIYVKLRYTVGIVLVYIILIFSQKFSTFSGRQLYLLHS